MSKARARALGVALLAGMGAVVWLYMTRQGEPTRTKEQVIAKVDSSLEKLASKGVSGSLLLSQDGEVWLARGYGFADRSTRRAVAPDTGFDIGSLVKQFTAAAILKLEDQGKLRLGDRLAALLPDAPPDKAQITVQQLLGHSSGLLDIVDANSDPIGYTPEFDYRPVSRDEIVRRALQAKLLFAPGEKVRYSNLGYSLLGAIIERASGATYEQDLLEALFRPSGMSRTGYLAPGWKPANLAVGYRKGEPWGTPLDHRWLADGPSWNLRANGGMLSTTQDLLKWIRALEGDSVFPPEEKEKFFKLNVHTNRRGARTMGPAGSNEILDACFLWYLDEHRVIVMLTSSDAYRAEEMVPDIAQRMRSVRASSPSEAPRARLQQPRT